MRSPLLRAILITPLLGPLVAVSVAVCTHSCAVKPVVEVSLSDPLGLLPQAVYAQVAVFDGGCPERAQLADGNLQGARVLLTAQGSDPFEPIGDLQKANFGFAALLRRGDCGVIGFGCTPADLDRHRFIAIAVNEPVSPARGACPPPRTCRRGACVLDPNSEGGVPEAQPDVAQEAGSGECELTLLGGESFDLPAAPGARYGGPVVVPTPTGFVVVYHEVDATGMTNRGVLQFVQDDAAKGTRTHVPVDGCASNLDSNGLAATWSHAYGGGFMALSRPACSDADTASLHVAIFDQTGTRLNDVSYPLPAPITIAPARGAAAYPYSTYFLLAANTGPVASLYTFDGLAVQPGQHRVFTDEGASTFALVASNEDMWGTLAGTGANTLAFELNDSSSGDNARGTLPAASFATIATWPGRAVVVAPDGSNLVWYALDSLGQRLHEGTLVGGPYTAVDATTLHAHVLIAGAQVGKISVFRVDDADNALGSAASTQVDLNAAVGGTSLVGYLGERVSIGANRNRVVVAWVMTTAPLAGATNVPGGYAVLSCDG
ncbi:MAG: hypothetical protein MUF54_02990 [Polyangiaceae bacterium]|jgi:hypothetical protein|nr:hypothetical protein [Polyangiaceae bacterium]